MLYILMTVVADRWRVVYVRMRVFVCGREVLGVHWRVTAGVKRWRHFNCGVSQSRRSPNNSECLSVSVCVRM